ncbi:exonuclease domain-containing protein [Streptomyces nojiriensis]|uniref:exonuclease domain-containing protein n=1 Tax=Streptomyces nojiriensis TaxID=66374 RepID=UPI002E19FD10
MTLASTVLDATDPHGYAFPWALVDVETSGLIPRRDRVLSIAVVTLGPDGRQTGEFTTLLNPGCDPGPVHVHGLTAELLSGAPTFDQVADRVGAMLQDRVMVAHNAPYLVGGLIPVLRTIGRPGGLGVALQRSCRGCGFD